MQTDTKDEKARFEALTRKNVEFLLNRYNRVNRWVIADMIRRSAYHYPDKTALIFQDREMTYTELEAACNHTANTLLDSGVTIGIKILGHRARHDPAHRGSLSDDLYYGKTKLASYHTILKAEDAWDKLGSAGRAGLNMETRLEADTGEIVHEPGQPGEICGKGPHAMMMYFKDMEKTDDVMRGGWFLPVIWGCLMKTAISRLWIAKRTSSKPAVKTWPPGKWRKPSIQRAGWRLSQPWWCPGREKA